MLSSFNPFIKPYLTTRNLHPENQETPIQFLKDGKMDEKLFYKRNHFDYPALSFSNYQLPVTGAVLNPRVFSLQDIFKLPSKTVKVILECAGNKRNLLKLTGLSEDAKEIVIEGYDFGKREDLDHLFPYARSLPLEKALHPDTLIAYAYNDQPIPFKHGYPLRLIVPHWYAMASVKWIKQITIIRTNFKGPFQSIDYVYYPNKENDSNALPVTTMHVNSTIQKPLDRGILDTGNHLIKGIAWTGEGTILKVEVSTNGGETWSNSKLDKQMKGNDGWCSWSYEWPAREKGEYTIMSRATDSHNRVQPYHAFWNRKGYGYNAIDKIQINII